MIAKQAKNGNWYINVEAVPAKDDWADSIYYKMWVSESLKDKLMAKQPTTIELERVKVDVEPFSRVDDEGSISESVFTKLTVTARCHKGVRVDDAEVMAKALRKQLETDGKVCSVVIDTDPMEGAIGDAE